MFLVIPNTLILSPTKGSYNNSNTRACRSMCSANPSAHVAVHISRIEGDACTCRDKARYKTCDRSCCGWNSWEGERDEDEKMKMVIVAAMCSYPASLWID